MALTGPAKQMQEYLSPWLEWAKTEPMASKIARALALLDTDNDAMVHFGDLEARATTQRHKKVTHHREVRDLFDDLKKHANGKKELRETHIKKTLENLSQEELADVIAELPKFLSHQRKPLLIRMMGDKFIGETVARALTDPLTEIGAAHLSPNVTTGLLASLGSQIKPEKGRS